MSYVLCVLNMFRFFFYPKRKHIFFLFVSLETKNYCISFNFFSTKMHTEVTKALKLSIGFAKTNQPVVHWRY